MAEIHPSLHIDDDWKRQAQEEKRKLAEAEAQKKAQAQPAQSVTPGPAAGQTPSPGTSTRRARGETPEASFGALVQTIMTQALFYLGELGTRAGQSTLDLDMAKLQIDLLGVLEQKTQGNLSPEETTLLDSALYETRMRFVSVAREYADLSGGR